MVIPDSSENPCSCFHTLFQCEFGAQEGYSGTFDAQLRSVFYQVKFFPNDPKSLGHSDFGPNFSKIIETKTSKKFRAAYNCGIKLKISVIINSPKTSAPVDVY